jgi:hypothetical protein
VEDLKFGLKQVRPSAMRQVVVDVPKVQNLYEAALKTV